MAGRKKLNSLSEYVDQLPPILCRMLARRWDSCRHHRGGLVPMTMREISLKSGIPIGRTIWIARQPSWKNVPVAEACAFREACGVRWGNLKAVFRFIKKQRRKAIPFAYLDQLRGSCLRNMEKHLKHLKQP